MTEFSGQCSDSFKFPCGIVLLHCAASPLSVHVSKERSPSTMKHISAARQSFSLLRLPSFFFLPPSIIYENERTDDADDDHPSESRARCHLCPNAEIIHLRTPRTRMGTSGRYSFALLLQTKIHIFTSIVGGGRWEQPSKGEWGKNN